MLKMHDDTQRCAMTHAHAHGLRAHGLRVLPVIVKRRKQEEGNRQPATSKMRVVVKNDQFGGDTTTLRELGEEVTVEELMHMVRDEPVCKDKAAGWCFARYDGTR